MTVNRRYFESLMADKQLSLRGLAQLMNMGHSQLSLTFSGARRLQLDEAAQLAKIFGEPLHKIVENAGVAMRPASGKTVPVIGAVNGDGTVALHQPGVIERAAAPDDLPDSAVAVQCRTAGSALDWIDSWVLFFGEPRGVDPSAMGRLAYCQIKSGPAVIASVRRGYKNGSYNLLGFFQGESKPLEAATPVLIIRP